MAKSAMPVSKAKTAYGLLSEIRKLILEEPKRYDQTTWNRRHLTPELEPACGTVCCVAGWVDVLKNPKPVCLSIHTDWDTPVVAARILGLNQDEGWELFDAEKAGRRENRHGDVTPDSLRRHAERGAKHIEKFQKKYAAQLKAKRV